MNYHNYKLEDFLTDEDFKKWVIEPDADRNQFWQSWIASNPEKKNTVYEAIEIIRGIKFRSSEDFEDHVHFEDQLETTLEAILQADESTTEQKGNHRNRFFYVIPKIAASLLFIIASAAFFYYITISPEKAETVANITTTIKENPAGQRSTLRLPDGTVVNLNSSSSISYQEPFTDSARYVELTGEAFFEVAHDPNKPFVVASGTVQTVALGTSFNVRAFQSEQDIRISLATGKVKVKIHGKSSEKETLLEPGQQLAYDKVLETQEKKEFSELLDLGWKDGIIVFEDADLDEFITTLERWYGVTFEVTGTQKSKWHIEGKFDNETLKEIMEGLSFTYNIQYEMEGKRIKIKL